MTWRDERLWGKRSDLDGHNNLRAARELVSGWPSYRHELRELADLRLSTNIRFGLQRPSDAVCNADAEGLII